MIQIWIEDDSSIKYAHFSSDVARFATLDQGLDAETVRSALLASADIRTDIQPRADRPIVWHDDDRDSIATFFQSMIDDAQAEILQKAIGADLYRYIVYILKFLELMSAQLGIRNLSDSVILGHEAGDNPIEQQKLAATWAEKSDAWLNLVGMAEREASAAKKAIADCENDEQMRAIVDAFPAKLAEVLAA